MKKNNMPGKSLKIQRYLSQSEAEWEQFAELNGTLFHLRKFLKYHPRNRFRDHSLIWLKSDRLSAIFPAVEIREHGEKWLVSHPGATFGSLITGPATGINLTMEVVTSLTTYGRENHFTGIRVTNVPVIYRNKLSDHVEFCFRKTGFSYVKQELSSVLELERNRSESLQRSSVNRAVRKALREGVRVKQDRDYSRFYRILLENLSLRHQVKPTHTLKELILLSRLVPERICLFSAYSGRIPLGGIVLFLCNTRVALAFYITHDVRYQNLRVVDALMVHVIDWCREEGFKYIDFGTFTLEMVPNYGLGRFKEKFGARGIFRNTLEMRF